jgi:hypothetical protein
VAELNRVLDGRGTFIVHDRDTIEFIATVLPFYPDPQNPSECELYIKQVFGAVVKHYGEDEARRIFGPYGRQRTKRQIKLENDAALLMDYHYECLMAEKSKHKPSVRRLALRLAKENNIDPIAMERKIWRVIKDKKVRQYLLEH